MYINTFLEHSKCFKSKELQKNNYINKFKLENQKKKQKTNNK